MRSIVIGKFYPPHSGHHYLIEYALERSDQVTVLVCDSPAYKIPANDRRRWLQTVHPKADVQIIPDLDDDTNSKRWAAHTLEFLGYTPDVVFSSESYGPPYAAAMNTNHRMVDQRRIHVPINATRVRANVAAEWQYLHPAVRSDLAKRIVVVGAESTGTTTLARGLAAQLKVPWVPEYGRLYTEAVASADHAWCDQDFTHIAMMQQQIERRAAQISRGVIVCDTNATATELWQKHYVGATTTEVSMIASQDIVDLYIITADDIPFVQDGTRADEQRRSIMHQDFLAHIAASEVPYIIVSGTHSMRLAQATAKVAQLLGNPGLLART